jgi:hypothetical protein
VLSQYIFGLDAKKALRTVDFDNFDKTGRVRRRETKPSTAWDRDSPAFSHKHIVNYFYTYGCRPRFRTVQKVRQTPTSWDSF